jgi:hypothetical protein
MKTLTKLVVKTVAFLVIFPVVFVALCKKSRK